MNKLSPKNLRRKFSRRALLRDSILSLGVGTTVGAGAYLGLSYAQRKIKGIVGGAEKHIRELALDVSELSGSLERKLVTERKELEEHYSQGTLNIYQELGIATPAEIREIETTLKNYEEFEDHYNFAERAREFKDRIDRRLMTVDESLESYQPEVLRNVNDSIREFFGKSSKEKGKEYRTQVKQRLEKLCTIYDTNSDNKRAQIEVMKSLNDYLSEAKLSPEEKELYQFLKEQHEKGCSEENFRHFVENYDNYTERQGLLLELKASLSEAERVYGDIQENKEYVSTLQDLLKEGIALKQEVRQKSVEEVSRYKLEIDEKIGELRTSVNGVISELRSKGYTVETRQDHIDKGYFAKSLDAILKPLVIGGTLIAGSLAGLVTFRGRTKTRNMRTINQALEEAISSHNNLVNKYNNLQGENQILSENITIEKNKNPSSYEYGNDIY